MFTAFRAFAATAAALSAAAAMTASASADDFSTAGTRLAASDAMVATIRSFTDREHMDFTRTVLASAETRVTAKIENVGYRKPAMPFQLAANFLPDE
jgi:hypothetical protein